MGVWRIALGAVLAVTAAWIAPRLDFVVQNPGSFRDDVVGLVRDREGNLIVAGTTSFVNGLHGGVPVRAQVRTYFSRNLVSDATVLAVERAHPDGFAIGLHLVRIRLPLRPSDNGRLLLTVSQGGETSREVPIHWQAP